MINNIRLLHYLSEDTYKKIYEKLSINDKYGILTNDHLKYPAEKIYNICLYNIIYKQFGHIWFLHIYINFPKFQCDFKEFENRLFKEYEKLFGKDNMTNFPLYKEINCDYIEYNGLAKVENADKTICDVRTQGCPPVHLEWEMEKLFTEPHAKIEFCVSKKDDKTIEYLARCHGLALKRRIKNKMFHVATGLSAPKMINEEIEKDLLNRLFKQYKINVINCTV